MSKKLSIVISLFNKWNFTKSCLNDLKQLSPDDHEIIIIDNASSDETSKEIEQFITRDDPQFISYVRNNTNTFHSKACNQGYNLAKGKNVLFLNNDIKVKSNHTSWTKSIIEACESNSLVGPTMGQLDSNLNFVKEANQQLAGNSYLSGWCVAASKKTWKQLAINNQIWNEQYPMYFNDTDLSFRARKNKITLNVIPLPDVMHFGKISASQINVHKLYTEGRQVFLKHWNNRYFF